ncbi:hypothetical protein JCM8547_008981 [Rhodosporidiobolus lusitaniae]
MTAPDSPVPPNPHLTSPILFCSGFTSATNDEEIVDALQHCLRLRLSIDRSSDSSAPASGKIEFESLSKAELAYATVNGQRLSSGGSLNLFLSPPPPYPSSSPSSDAQPSATPRLIKQLPLSTTPLSLFALLRPYGPIHSLTLLLAPVPAHAPAGSQPRFKGHAVVSYYEEEDAGRMVDGVHFSEVGGQNVAVSVWDEERAKRAGRKSAGGRSSLGGSLQAPQNGFEQTSSASSPAAGRTSRWAAEQASPSSPSAHSSAFSPPSTPMQPSRSQSKYASPSSGGGAGLGIGGAAPSTPMGRTASAMSQWSAGSAGGGSENGTHYQERRERGEVDPCNLFIKSLPPTLTSPHLHALFSPFGTIVSARVMTTSSSPPVSKEFGFVSFTSPEMAVQALRAIDGKYVCVVEEGNKEGEGEEVGEVVLGEKARGREGARRVTVRVHEKKAVREGRVSAGGAGEGLEKSFAALITETGTPSRSPLAGGSVVPAPSSPSLSPSASRWASPSAPASPSPAIADSPVQVATKSERERLVEAVRGVGGVKEEEVEEVVGLLESLPKKDRALALFNPSVLAQKVQDALAILSVQDENEDDQRSLAAAAPSSTSPAAPAPAPASLDSLLAGPLPSLLTHLRSTPAGQSPEVQEKEQETNLFMDGLEGKPVNEVKQKLGERVFKALKKEGVKGAPRITIDLLDSEPDLRALAQLVNYPEALRRKAEMVKEAIALGK